MKGMALMIKLAIEEDEKKLNIVIWNDVDDKTEPVNNPVANLTIPLRTSNKQITISENIWDKFIIKEAPVKNIEPSSEENNETLKLDAKCKENFADNEENNFEPVLENESEGEDLSFASYLEYIRKKSEAYIVQNNNRKFDARETKAFPTSEAEIGTVRNENGTSQSVENTNKNITDTMSIASDDYSLLIDDDPIEKADPKNVDQKNSDQMKENQKQSFTTPVKMSPKKKFTPTTFSCQSCDRVFAKKSSHRQHMIAVHELKFACPICNLSFPVRRQLLLHFRNHGSQSAPSTRTLYPCTQCSRKYKCQKALKDHSKTHLPIQSRFFWRISKMNVSFPEKSKIVKVNTIPNKSVLK